ncbi:MAG: SigB/SigF/SigG family RNA polymerase sigma factor [Abditibacteriales bacterium]|nr:SigB/SigF/SigG family RNA polymerase sigma factor [Abditibacteriales bacterium]MDW8366989.1 SigB/SigF/SigG family RNA polymerase sigma factor [Abditibacteriales bacterium]
MPREDDTFDLPELIEEGEEGLEFERLCKKWKALRARSQAARAQALAEKKPTAQEQWMVEADALQREADALRAQLIKRNERLVRFLAHKFKDKGEPLEDLIQQGMIGLINAIDRYDPDRGVKFSTYATPTILGEIKRYFRDKTWSVKVPRRIQELNLLVHRIADELTQELGRSPTLTELAQAVGASEEDVLEALEIGKAYDPISLDSESSGSDKEDTPTTLEEHVRGQDSTMENWETHLWLKDALQRLPPRERRVVELTFFEGLSQLEIAKELGMSQMHVSRLLRKALARLREYFRRE